MGKKIKLFIFIESKKSRNIFNSVPLCKARWSGLESFNTFYITNKDKLFGYLIRMTGDYQLSSDILQESFTRLLSSYGSSEQHASLLYKIARNALIDSRRRNRKEVDVEVADFSDEKNPEKDMMIRESYRNVLEAMKHLEETERDVLSLSVSHDFSYREIAVIAGISEANVRVKIHRARLKLKEILGMNKGDVRHEQSGQPFYRR